LDLAQQYIIQCIIAAANNLRLSSEKIETVAIIRERLNQATDLSEEIKKFKKITELSKLGIKLGELQIFIDNGKIDFSKISDKFKEHSFSLVRELNIVLDVVTPQTARALFQKFEQGAIKVDLTKRPENVIDNAVENAANLAQDFEIPKRSHTDELKEQIIFDELNKENDFSFENYEDKVLRPVKELDSFLSKVFKYEYSESQINNYIKIMNENAEFSKKIGFEILSNMHRIFARGLDMINQKKISPSLNVIESLRSCLIVIVAVVRGKEVDITSYLNRAENFGKTILPKQKEK
jgi:hypothetical protein